MKIAKFFGIAAVAFAVPSIAQAQARIEVRAGLDVAETSLALSDDTVTVRGEDSRNGFNYGVEVGYDMRASENLISNGLKHVLESTPVNSCYMLNDQGKEVPITTAMIRSACHQLLQRCRAIKK